MRQATLFTIVVLTNLASLTAANSCQVSIFEPRADDLVSNDFPLKIFFNPLPNQCNSQIRSVTCTCGNKFFPNCGSATIPFFHGCDNDGDDDNQMYYEVPYSTMSSCRDSSLCVNITTFACGHTDRTFRVNSYGISITYIICSVFSILSCSLVIYLYMTIRPARQFPSNLIFWRVICDLLFSIQLLWINAWEITGKEDRETACNGAIAFVTQFSLLSSLCWYFVLALNLYLSISNPFSKPQSKVKLYHYVIWTVSTVTGLYLGFNNEYRADYQLCWVPKIQGLNPINWTFYFTWLFVFAFLAVLFLIYGEVRLRNRDGEASHLAHTLEKRMEALRQTRTYVIVFTMYWTAAGIIWAFVFFTSKSDKSNRLIQVPALAYIFAMVAGSLGVVDTLLFIYVQRNHLSRVYGKQPVSGLSTPRGDETDEIRDEFEDISDALRYEYIDVTSYGIISATKQAVEEFQHQELTLDNVMPTGNVHRRSSARSYSDAKAEPLLEEQSVVQRVSSRMSHGYGDDVTLTVDFDDVTMRQKYPDCEFRAYRPYSFYYLRCVFGVPRDQSTFLQSMGGAVKQMKQNFSEGASGSFFYMTVDRKYLVKTLTRSEYHFFLSFLYEYIKYMDSHRLSLICKFYGMYSVKLYNNTVYFVVMNNWLLVDPEAGYSIDEIYDLKGSWINRGTTPPTEKHGKRKKVKTRKDNDLNYTVRIGSDLAEQVRMQLAQDARFMADMRIMDYSLLLGVGLIETEFVSGSSPAMAREGHRRPTFAFAHDKSLTDFSKQSANMIVGPGMYHFGIIDVLQEWNWTKRAEHWLKIILKLHCFDWEGMSAVEPDLYCRRFIIMTRRVFSQSYIPPPRSTDALSPIQQLRRMTRASEGHDEEEKADMPLVERRRSVAS